MYSVTFRDRPVILSSRLGIDPADEAGLGRDSTVEGVRTRTIHETYTQRPGKRSRVVEPLRGGDRRAPRAGRAVTAMGGHPSGLRRRGRLALSLPRPGGLDGPRDRRRADRFHLPDDAVGLCPAPEWLYHLPRGPLPEEARGRDSQGVAPRAAAARRAAGHRLAGVDGGGPDRLRGDVSGARRRGQVPTWRPGSPRCPASRRSPSGPSCRTSRPGGSS